MAPQDPHTPASRPPGPLARPLAELGAFFLGLARQTREIAWTLRATVRQTLRGRREPGAALYQMYQVGNRSLLFVAVTMGFIAMVGTYQVCFQLNRVTGDLSQVGAEFIKLLIHETGPTITAMMLCTRVGAGIAAEVGSMVVTEQVDALRMNGVDPVSYLIVPRFVACLVMVPVLTLLAFVVSIAAAMAMAYAHFGVNPRVFIDLSAVTAGDLGTGLVKSLCYGVAIPVVSGACGLFTHGGAEGVGSATTRAVIGASLAVLVLDFIIGALSFVLLHSGGAA